MLQEKEYFAFISYQRKDEKWADRLRSKLEHYRLPSSVRKQDASLPKEIRPIFRDALELAGGVLAKEIETALQNSKFLIVICSPNSAKSPWVNKEIQTFIDLGREDRIIPFIIDGTPFSDNQDSECFPPALRSLRGEKELLGININELSRDAASIKVVARMFGLKFDTLWQRYEREKKRKRWMWIGGSLLIAFWGLCIGGYFVKQNRVIESQNERLLQDSITMANHLQRIQSDSVMLSAQNDSIASQNELILNQRDSLNISMRSLQLSNRLLAEERDNVIKANWNLKLTNAKILSEHAMSLLNKGQRIETINVLSQICNDKDAYELVKLPEVEYSLRRAYREQNKEGISPRFMIDGIGKTSIAQFDATGNSLYLVLNDSSIIRYSTNSGLLEEVVDIIPGVADMRSVDISAFNGSKGLVVYSGDSTLFIRNINSHKNIITPIKFADVISDVIVSPQCDKIVIELSLGKYPNIIDEWHLIEVNGHSVQNHLLTNCDNVYAFSPDGNSLFLDMDDEYYIYDVTTKEKKHVPFDTYVKSAHFSTNGENLIIQTERKDSLKDNEESSWIDVYHIPSNEFVRFSEYITGPQFCEIQENPQQNRFIVGDMRGNLKVVNSEKLQYYSKLKKGLEVFAGYSYSLSKQPESIKSIKFDKDGNRMLTITNGKVCVWDVKIKDLLQKINDRPDFTASSGKGYVKRYMGSIQLFDSENNKPIVKLFSDDRSMQVQLISRNNDIVAATEDSLLYVINTVNHSWFTIPFRCHTYSLELSMDEKGEKLLVWDGRNGNTKPTLSIYDVRRKKLISTNSSYLSGHFALRPNGKELVMSEGNNINIIDANTLEIKKKMSAIHSGYIASVGYSPNGDYIFSASWDRTVCLWDASTGKLEKRLYGADRELWSCSISADGKYLIASTNNKLEEKTKNYIWEIKSGEIVERTEASASYNFFQDKPSMLYVHRYKLGHDYDTYLSFPSISELLKAFQQ